ncbi:hypothetical protein [Mixta intestinalis]|uniref:Uncharacterized protein n=1 Tax=Mixta intestinalis TaxID=1615494 RepID=A0A6P1PYQ6_9GAMM|nr:hypothetical protein [Mixta intestinalis]QHM70987.1 hypothetical protein C7M51_01269 [Mixta intestinalis]
MPDKMSYIVQLINKGYRLPHDIEVVAGEIYCALQHKELASDDVINEFINSVVTSKYKDIVEITYNYMNRLIYSGDNLLYEEFLKVLHLFDSINILSFLGLDVSAEIIEKSDADMIFFLKRYDKWAKQFILEYIKGKQWWQRILY